MLILDFNVSKVALPYESEQSIKSVIVQQSSGYFVAVPGASQKVRGIFRYLLSSYLTDVTQGPSYRLSFDLIAAMISSLVPLFPSSFSSAFWISPSNPARLRFVYAVFPYDPLC